MIAIICLAICVICLGIIIYFQRKDIDNLRETIYDLILLEKNNIKLWNEQVGINSSIADFMSDVNGIIKKEKNI